METIKGMPVTDQEIEAWAQEAEVGYDVVELKKRGRPRLGVHTTSVIPVRMDQELIEALNQKAQAKDLNRSEAIRAAVKAWVVA